MITTIVYAVALMSQQITQTVEEKLNEPRYSIPKPVIEQPINVSKSPRDIPPRKLVEERQKR